MFEQLRPKFIAVYVEIAGTAGAPGGTWCHTDMTGEAPRKMALVRKTHRERNLLK